MSLTFTDIFCGAGGSSIGLGAAGMELVLAANHWAGAIETDAANFTSGEHLRADVSDYDMRHLPRTNVLWASPVYTELSAAGGRRRCGARRDLLEQHSLYPIVVDIDDCRFRMLKPCEHLRAQHFDGSYVVTGSKDAQTMRAGNAVSANVALWLGNAVMQALS